MQDSLTTALQFLFVLSAPGSGYGFAKSKLRDQLVQPSFFMEALTGNVLPKVCLKVNFESLLANLNTSQAASCTQSGSQTDCSLPCRPGPLALTGQSMLARRFPPASGWRSRAPSFSSRLVECERATGQEGTHLNCCRVVISACCWHVLGTLECVVKEGRGPS